VKIRHIILFLALLLSFKSIAYCESGPSYDDTVTLIKKTMASSTSDFRKESYTYIRFDKCVMNYNVLGTFPSGGLYDIKYRDIDFSGLNGQVSKTGRDYTSFVVLNFSKDLHAKDDSNDLTIHTVVVNVSDDDSAHILFKAFLHLGELCGANRDLR
jgi:hypothetical protein